MYIYGKILLTYQLLTDNLVLFVILFIFGIILLLLSIIHLIIITQLQICVISKLYRTIPEHRLITRNFAL